MRKKKRDEEIRKVTDELSALLDRIEAVVAAVPEEFRAALAVPDVPEETEEGEALAHEPR